MRVPFTRVRMAVYARVRVGGGLRPTGPATHLPASPLAPSARSAVDQHTARHIFDKCIKGIFKDKAVIWITHQLELLPEVNHLCQRT